MKGTLLRAISIVYAIASLAGCAARSDRVGGDDVIFLVPGVAGASSSYQQLINGLHEGGVASPVQIVEWGAPPILFFMNFNSQAIHDRAESEFASRLTRWQNDHRRGRIDIIGHSAGCGVALGALAKVDRGVRVSTVILLAPSVSPTFNLPPAIQHIEQTIQVFYSGRDTLFLSWRTSTFGSYDNVKTRAAGNAGFDLSSLGPNLRRRITQHAYDSAWQKLGNDGGHYGALSRPFASQVIAPLLSASEVEHSP